MSRNIFNDSTETELNQRTINFQNLSVLDATIPILNTGNIVSGQVVGTAGLNIISKETLDEIKEDVLETRLKNLSNASITSESVATINGDIINSTPVSTAGKSLMNITSIADLRSQILETAEEAIVFTPTDGNNEINFYTGTTQTASDLRLQLKDELITLQVGDESMNMKLDNQNTWISFSEQLVFDNLEGDKINFYKSGNVLQNNLYKLEVDITTGNTKTLVYVSPEEHLFKVKDTDNPAGDVLQDILLIEKDHVHITSDSGIMLNGGFNIKNGNHGEIATTTGNKNLYYKTHGTGEHIFYVDDTTEIFKIAPTSINCNKILKTIVAEGDKIHWDATSRVYTSPGEIHYYTSDRDALFWADGIFVMRLRGTDIVMNKPLSVTGGITGDLIGNASTSTKIASITNSDIVQLDATQILTNKTLTAPTITGATIAGNILPSVNGTFNIGSSSLRFNTGYINDIEINVCNVAGGIIFPDTDNTKITLNTNHTIGVSSAKTQYTAPTHQFLSGAVPIFDIALAGMVAYKNILPTTDSTIDLGTSLKKYNYVYTDNIETETINSSNTITFKNGVNNLLSLSNTETTTYNDIVPNDATGSLSLGSSTNRYYYVYAYDISVLNTVNSNLVYASTVEAPTVNATTINFPVGFADKILLSGATYKLAVSDSSIDYISADKHTFKTASNNLLALDNTNLTTYKTIIPDTTATIDLGSSGKIFNTGYITTLKTSSISPEATDSNLVLAGNGIGTVFLQSALSAPIGAILGETVIGAIYAYGKFGVKSDGGAIFIGNPAWDDNYSIFGHGIDSKNALNQYGLAVGIGTNSTSNYGVIKCIEPGLIWRDLHFSAGGLYFDHSGTERMRVAGNVVVSTNLIPGSDNTRDLGSSSNRWKEIWAAVGSINTSDRNKKKEIDYEDIDKFADELLNLKPCSYKFIQNTSDRTHLGLISQDLENGVFSKTGAFIKSPKTKKITEIQIIDGMKSNIEKEVEIENEFIYGLRYNELISPLIRLCQIQQKQIDDLVARVEILESGTSVDHLSFI